MYNNPGLPLKKNPKLIFNVEVFKTLKKKVLQVVFTLHWFIKSIKMNCLIIRMRLSAL